MNITIGENWKLTSDEHNYILSKKTKSKKGKVNYAVIAYCVDLEQVVNELVDASIRPLEADTLQKLIDDTTQLKKDLINAIRCVAK